MLSKNRAKFILSLHTKKNREAEGLFIAEGPKLCKEILNSDWPLVELLASEEFIRSLDDFAVKKDVVVTAVSKEELKKISGLTNPDDAVLVCKANRAVPDYALLNKDMSLYLDGIRDPGNLGTIIRVCDWFGIKNVFCSPDSTELYNPKTIQASMGSFLRVNVFYTGLNEILSELKTLGIQLPVYGAFMEGRSIYKMQSWSPGLLVLGNEANGISTELEQLINQKISIPSFNKNGPESLNVAIAASLIVGEYRSSGLR